MLVVAVIVAGVELFLLLGVLRIIFVVVAVLPAVVVVVAVVIVVVGVLDIYMS